MSTYNLEELYKKAIEIELNSQSPRIKEMHSKEKYCWVELGHFDPHTTEFMFVTLNPGTKGDPACPNPQNHKSAAETHCSFAEYMKSPFPYSRKFMEFLTSFSSKKSIAPEKTLSLFGMANVSFFPSKKFDWWDISNMIELHESLPVLLRELECVTNLRALIFSGIPLEYFFSQLYKTGAPITKVQSEGGKHIWVCSFKTTIRTDQDVDCAFMVHISGTRGLTNQSLKIIGERIAQVV